MKNILYLLLIGLLFSCAGGGVPKEESAKEESAKEIMSMGVTAANDTVLISSKGDSLTLYLFHTRSNIKSCLLTKVSEVTLGDGTIKKIYINVIYSIITTVTFLNEEQPTYLTLLGGENDYLLKMSLRVIYTE